MTFGSLFAGIGGLDLGLERAGMECRWQVEIDEYCRKVLAKHWPHVKRYGDIKNESGADLERVDLICGGFPCQPVSVAGRRKRQDDSRWLWPQFARIVRALRPPWVLIENVPGLLTGDWDMEDPANYPLWRSGMSDVLGELAASGYDAEWDCIPAAALGAPHLRYRTFIVAYPNGQREQQCEGIISNESGRVGDKVPKSFRIQGRDEERMRQPERYHRIFANHPSARLQERQNEDMLRELATLDGSPAKNAAQFGFEGKRRPRSKRQRKPELTLCKRSPREQIRGSGWWATEPGLVRMVHGISHRVDRIRALGNSVIPQVAEEIGRRIVEAEAKAQSGWN